MFRPKDVDLYHPNLERTRELTRLDLNENFGPVHQRIRIASSRIDSSNILNYDSEFISASQSSVSKLLRLSQGRVFFNNGAAEVLRQVISALDMEGFVILCQPAWPYYQTLCNIHRLKTKNIHLIDEGDRYSFPISDIIDSGKNASAVIINSPHMPTGSVTNFDEIETIASRLPNTLIIVDEAYWGYSTQYQLNSIELNEVFDRRPNILIIRTMSKFFGLAGVRVGFGISHEDVLNRVRPYGPLFGISVHSSLVAQAAIESYAHYWSIAQKVEMQRDFLKENINKMSNFVAYQSYANFLLIKSLATPVRRLVNSFCGFGLKIKSCESYGLSQHIRVTIGNQDTTERVMRVLNNRV